MFRNPKLKNLGDVLRRNAQRYPESEALVTGSVRFTWSELNARSNRLAHGLMSLGLAKGDRVAVISSNCHQWIELTFAVHKIGAVFVPINYRFAPSEVAGLVQDAGAAILFSSQEFSHLETAVRDSCPSVKGVVCMGSPSEETLAYKELMASGKDTEPEVEVEPGDMAYIAYTGGTTGLPKGAVWLHDTLLNTIQDIPYSYEVAFKSRELIPVPSFAAGVIVQIMNAVYCAATLIFINFDPMTVLEMIARERAELMAAAAVPLFMLASRAAAPGDDLSSLKRIFYGGGSMSPAQLKKIRTVFTCELQQGYGGTETLLNVTQLNPYDHLIEDGANGAEKAVRLSSGGRVNKGVEIRLVDPQGIDVSLGEIGEIAVKSRSLLTSYWNRPEDTRNALRDGWYYTSDMGYMDEEGYLFIVDRKNDMIKSGGISVYPAEVESVLAGHPDVREAAVVGAPDEIWGERIVAVVVLSEGSTVQPGDIRTFCRGRIADFKIPKEIVFRDELPRSGLGKVMRKILKEEYRSGEAKKRVV